MACIWEGVQLRSATIIPDHETAGHVAHRNILKGREIDSDSSTSNRLRMERLVRVSLAGPAAGRRYSKRLSRSWHGDHDRRRAINLLSYFTGTRDELEAHFRLLELQAEHLFDRPGAWSKYALSRKRGLA